MNTGIKRSINTLHNEKIIRFVMDIPIEKIFSSSSASEYFGYMQKGLHERDSEMLLMMTKMVRKIEDESDVLA